jgi:hypothetical protein
MGGTGSYVMSHAVRRQEMKLSQMSLSSHRPAIAVCAALVLALSFLVFWWWIGGGFVTEKRNKVLVPRGYQGWICIAYGIQDAPPLPLDDDGYRVVRIPANGVVKTSTLGRSGPLKDVYVLYAQNGEITLMPASYFGGGGTHAEHGSPDGNFAFFLWVSPNPTEDYKRLGEPSSEVLRGRCF